MAAMPTHCPLMQALPGPHGVPSAQGKCLVWQTARPPARPLHQSAAQGGCTSPQCRESAPKASWHCRSTGYAAPGSAVGSRSHSEGLSRRQ